MPATEEPARARNLTGTVAVVTGTSPNIGAGIAVEFAAAGAAVACLDVAADSAERCAAAIRDASGTAMGVVCDVRDEQSVREAFARVEAELGSPSTLVNAAAIYNNKGIIETTVEEWRRQLDIILTGAFLCTKAAIASMREAGIHGSVINVSSTAGYQGEPSNVCYGTAKAGILNFTRAVAMDVARYGIRVNSLTPSATDPQEAFDRIEAWALDDAGPFSDREGLTALMEGIRRKVPLGRLPAPSDYGRAAVFLASDDARAITGTDLRVDGGTVAKHWSWNPGDVLITNQEP